MARKAARKTPQDGSPKQGLSDALAAAAWREADAALAQAWADFAEMENASGAKRAVLLALVGQSIARAARRRGLTCIGAPGDQVRFDPQRHVLVRSDETAPDQVRVLAPAIERGGEVLVKGRVNPAPKRGSG
jgi:hypothetical protein